MRTTGISWREREAVRENEREGEGEGEREGGVDIIIEIMSWDPGQSLEWSRYPRHEGEKEVWAWLGFKH